MSVQIIGFEKQTTEDWGHRYCLSVGKVDEVDHCERRSWEFAIKPSGNEATYAKP